MNEELIIESNDTDLIFGTVYDDGMSICMEVFTGNHYIYISPKDAIEIINHLKQQFEL